MFYEFHRGNDDLIANYDYHEYYGEFSGTPQSWNEWDLYYIDWNGVHTDFIHNKQGPPKMDDEDFKDFLSLGYFNIDGNFVGYQVGSIDELEEFTPQVGTTLYTGKDVFGFEDEDGNFHQGNFLNDQFVEFKFGYIDEFDEFHNEREEGSDFEYYPGMGALDISIDEIIPYKYGYYDTGDNWHIAEYKGPNDTPFGFFGEDGWWHDFVLGFFDN